MKLDNAFGLHEQALQLRSRRAEVLASNLTNADTPNYKAREFDFAKLMQQQLVQPVRQIATPAAHIRTDGGLVAATQLQFRIPQQATLDGNTVEIESEQARYGANALQYQASLRFLDGKIKGLMTALTGN